MIIKSLVVLKSSCFRICFFTKNVAVEKNGHKIAVALSVESLNVARQLLQLSFTIGIKVMLICLTYYATHCVN